MRLPEFVAGFDGHDADRATREAHLDVEISAKVAASSLLPRTCVSPELQGRGSTVNLFTSHKARSRWMAWIGGRVGVGEEEN